MLPKAHLTSHSRMSGPRWVITSSGLSGSLKPFLYSSVYSSHPFLISSASVRSLQFPSFTMIIFAWNVPLVSPVFLKRSLVFPSYFLPLFLCIVHLRTLFYLSLLFSVTLHSVGYIFSFLLCLFASLLFLAICKASSDNHFVFLHFFFLGMVLVTDSCTTFWTVIHSSSGTLYIRPNPLNLFVTSNVYKGFYFP